MAVSAGSKFGGAKRAGITPKLHDVLETPVYTMGMAAMEYGPLLTIGLPHHRIGVVSRVLVGVLTGGGAKDRVLSAADGSAIMVPGLEPTDDVQRGIVAAAKMVRPVGSVGVSLWLRPLCNRGHVCQFLQRLLGYKLKTVWGMDDTGHTMWPVREWITFANLGAG